MLHVDFQSNNCASNNIAIDANKASALGFINYNLEIAMADRLETSVYESAP